MSYAANLVEAPIAITATPAAYYLRMELMDKPGALAKVAKSLGDAGVSIDRMRQYSHNDPTAPVLIVTHKTNRTELDTALKNLTKTDMVAHAPVAIRIEEL